jgi:hypothetical protein
MPGLRNALEKLGRAGLRKVETLDYLYQLFYIFRQFPTTISAIGAHVVH